MNLFNDPNGHRGAAVVTIKMHEIYDLIRARLEYVDGNFDPDALCQNICVEIEKHQGTFPNLGGMPVDDGNRYPAYRLVAGEVCRQDVPGGRWEPLSKDEANALLATLDAQWQVYGTPLA